MPAVLEEDRPGGDLAELRLRTYAADLRRGYARELVRKRELQDAYLSTAQALAAAVEAKDGYTRGHIRRVHRLAVLLAGAVAPGEVDDPQLTYGLLLHDVGKLAVPDAILAKPGSLDEHEWAVVRQHPVAGARMLRDVPHLGRGLAVLRHHHERWDGRGYPDGLSGEAIPLWARIFAVVDTVDAITSDRPYRPARSLSVALDEVRAGAGAQFDPACVAAFTALPRADVLAALAY